MQSKAQIPEKIYVVFTCSDCGEKFEKPMDFYVTRHPRFGTATISVVSRTDKQRCCDCITKILDEQKKGGM